IRCPLFQAPANLIKRCCFLVSASSLLCTRIAASESQPASEPTQPETRPGRCLPIYPGQSPEAALPRNEAAARNLLGYGVAERGSRVRLSSSLASLLGFDSLRLSDFRTWYFGWGAASSSPCIRRHILQPAIGETLS